MAMTTEELHDLILGDPAAKAMADAGNDAGAAARASEIAPPIAASARHTYLSLARSDNGIGIDATRRLIVAIRAAAAADPLVDEVQYRLRGDTGVDVSDADVHAMLDAFVAANIPNGINADDAASIKSLSATRQSFIADQVSAAWLRYRPDGKVVA